MGTDGWSRELVIKISKNCGKSINYYFGMVINGVEYSKNISRTK
jgi:hypothetical protein